MTTIITDAHRAEARRRLIDAMFAGYGSRAMDAAQDLLAQALAEPAWTPPVDPDLIEARECAALACQKAGASRGEELIRSEAADEWLEVQSALIAIKRSKGQ